jgi:hypothetical protein
MKAFKQFYKSDNCSFIQKIKKNNQKLTAANTSKASKTPDKY